MMPRYLLAIHTDESRYATMTPEDFGQTMAEYTALTQDAKAAGVWVAGEGLRSSDTAKTVRVRDGERLLTDGPFAETREQLGGFYLLDCASMDEALEWAARIPDARAGGVEVRPVMDTGTAGGAG